MVPKLAFDFYARAATTVAPDLLGKILVRQTHMGFLRGRIVETEAYLGQLDAASHAYRGRTPRTGIMFGPAAHLYVYFTYGMHYCANVVTGEEGSAQAVLLRAVEPLEGVELMQQNRGQVKLTNLCSGPAKLAQAYGLNMSANGQSLLTSDIWIENTDIRVAYASSPRIGISQAIDKPWRYFVPDNPHVSKPNKNRYNTPHGRAA